MLLLKVEVDAVAWCVGWRYGERDWVVSVRGSSRAEKLDIVSSSSSRVLMVFGSDEQVRCCFRGPTRPAIAQGTRGRWAWENPTQLASSVILRSFETPISYLFIIDDDDGQGAVVSQPLEEPAIQEQSRLDIPPTPGGDVFRFTKARDT